MKKLTKSKIVFNCSRSASQYFDRSYTWCEAKKEFALKNFELLDNDRLYIGYDEGFNDPDNSRDSSYDIKVYRDVEETDEELVERERQFGEFKIKQEKKNHALYLKLKEQFENTQP